MKENKNVLNFRGSCLTESELVRGKHGRAIHGDWHKVREVEDCSWREIKRSHKSED
jgi:hypothetical protein